MLGIFRPRRVNHRLYPVSMDRHLRNILEIETCHKSLEYAWRHSPVCQITLPMTPFVLWPLYVKSNQYICFQGSLILVIFLGYGIFIRHNLVWHEIKEH
jgi:hypothetical protein